jgi:hypothetical protein
LRFPPAPRSGDYPITVKMWANLWRPCRI